jgi:hypothetical protein
LAPNKIIVEQFDRFRGGLDTSHNGTGIYSVYETHENCEIMFHISTLLPFSDRDEQQIGRKRFIGNNRVCIVFQEDETFFSPSMVDSKLLHVFIVIQPHRNETSGNFFETKYKVSRTLNFDGIKLHIRDRFY